jgi:dolichol-phosphate mannosyltransferase
VTPASRLSIVTPAWNEARNLPVLYERLRAAADRSGLEWEWIVVDDHSRDGTFAVVRDLAHRDSRVRGIRFARNAGSHVAILCGLDEAGGDAAVVLAADLQDPPETLPELLERWRGGAQVVWAARRVAPGQRASNAGFAGLYYWMMRRLIGLTDMPATGADFFLVDRAVIDAVRRFRERHVSVLALITWLGFRQERIEYEKQPRLHGRSGWSVAKKVKLVLDSLTAFSHLPVTACWAIGALLVAVGGALLVAGVLGTRIGALSAEGAIVSGVVAGVGGLVLVMLGLIGEYVWRALDEGRRRPRYLVEARVDPVGSPRDASALVR